MSAAYCIYVFLIFILAVFDMKELHGRDLSRTGLGRSLARKVAQVLQPSVIPDVAPLVQEALQTMPNLDKIPDGSAINVILQINTAAQKTNVDVNPILFDDYKKMLNSSKVTLQNGITTVIDYITNNKKIAFLGVVAGSYAALQTALSYLNYQLKKESCWSVWRSNKLTNLTKKSGETKNKFGKKLLNDIQQAYTISNDPTDFVSPLTRFMKDTDQELKQLKLYQRLTKVIDILHIKRLFFYDQKLTKNIPERLENLGLYRKIFLSWLGTVKVNQTRGLSTQDLKQRALKSTTKKSLCYLQTPNA